MLHKLLLRSQAMQLQAKSNNVCKWTSTNTKAQQEIHKKNINYIARLCWVTAQSSLVPEFARRQWWHIRCVRTRNAYTVIWSNKKSVLIKLSLNATQSSVGAEHIKAAITIIFQLVRCKKYELEIANNACLKAHHDTYFCHDHLQNLTKFLLNHVQRGLFLTNLLAASVFN